MTPALPADRYGVIGHPVAHSQSPWIHARFAALTHQALVYEPHLAPLDGFADTVRALAAAGVRGCNVTVPFKTEAAQGAASLSERARLAGAANTLSFRADGGYDADNTDGLGLMADITRGAGVPLAARRVLLIGAGGAGAGVLGPLLAERPAQVLLANRSPERAHALAARHADWAHQHGVALQACGLGDPLLRAAGFDVVLNASSSSLGGAAPPVPSSTLKPGALALDLMYGPAAQPFLDWARAHGAVPRDGLGMLVEQAAAAFALWRVVAPPTAPVLAELRQRLASPRAYAQIAPGDEEGQA